MRGDYTSGFSPCYLWTTQPKSLRSSTRSHQELRRKDGRSPSDSAPPPSHLLLSTIPSIHLTLTPRWKVWGMEEVWCVNNLPCHYGPGDTMRSTVMDACRAWCLCTSQFAAGSIHRLLCTELEWLEPQIRHFLWEYCSRARPVRPTNPPQNKCTLLIPKIQPRLHVIVLLFLPFRSIYTIRFLAIQTSNM